MVKVLVVKPRPGSLKSLFTKLTQINTKNGPFALILCCSDIFSDSEESKQDADALLAGDIQVPVVTYCTIGKNNVPESIQRQAASNAGMLCQNLILLDAVSVTSLATLGGLRLGSFGGTFSVESYQASQVQTTQITSASLTAFQALVAAGPVDILLSQELPQLITLHSVNLPKDTTAPAWGCAPMTEVVKSSKPRYHFAGGISEFWEREPWTWDDTGRVTRFLTLGEFGNKTKERWFYAFNIEAIPLGSQQPPPPVNSTKCPYSVGVNSKSQKRSAEADFDDSAPDFRFGNGAMDQGRKRGKVGPPPTSYTCKICRVAGHWIQDCPERSDQITCHVCKQPGHKAPDCPMAEQGGRRRGARREGPPQEITPDSCWFCLSNPKVTKHLVASVGNETYLTLPKGQLPDTQAGCPVPGGGHVLILPISHYPSFTALPHELAMPILSEVEQYKSSLRACYAAFSAAPVWFEVTKTLGPGGRAGHAHLQICPVPESLADDVEHVIKQEGEKLGINLEENVEHLSEEVDFFRIGLPDGRTLVHVMRPNQRFNLQFGRIALAQVLGMSERSDWKVCAQDEVDEKRDCQAFKKAFAKFEPKFE